MPRADRRERTARPAPYSQGGQTAQVMNVHVNGVDGNIRNADAQGNAETDFILNQSGQVDVNVIDGQIDAQHVEAEEEQEPANHPNQAAQVMIEANEAVQEAESGAMRRRAMLIEMARSLEDMITAMNEASRGLQHVLSGLDEVAMRVEGAADLNQRGLLSNELEMLPEAKVDVNGPNGTCNICVDSFECDQTYRTLPCMHHFHKDCIDKWLDRSKRCPTCKNDVEEYLKSLDADGIPMSPRL